MARLIYSAIASLDGYVEDHEGKFDWAGPDDEVHAVRRREIGIDDCPARAGHRFEFEHQCDRRKDPAAASRLAPGPRPQRA